MEQIILNYKKLYIILCLMETAPCSFNHSSSLFHLKKIKIIIIIHMLDIYHIIIFCLKQKKSSQELNARMMAKII